jgi:acyl-CoA thioester hydrolase
MLRLLEEARILAFWAPDPDEVDENGQVPSPVIDGRPGSGTLTVIAAQRLEYLESIPFFRRPLDIQMWFGRIGGASLEVSYEVRSPVGHTPSVLYTRATTVLVLVDAETQRPRRLTDAEREVCEPFIEEPVKFSRA